MRNILYKLNKCEVEVILDGITIKVRVGTNEFYANYPMNIEDVSKDLIDAMIWILFYDYGEFNAIKYKGRLIDRPPFYPKERKNENTVISFSGGIDSTAILTSFEGKPIHLLRDYDWTYSSKQMQIAKNISLVIPNDMERIRKLYGKSQGFNIGFGYIALILPLVDKMNIKRILFGVVFDDVGFYFGDPFEYNGEREYTNTSMMIDLLQGIGVDICYPFAGLSEVWTTKIVNESKYSGVATSCHDKSIGNACRACYKCFRKQGILGKKIPINNKIIKYIINKNLEKPVKMAASTIYGIQKAGYQGKQFEKFHDIDVSFLDRWNPKVAKIYNSPEMFLLVSKKMQEYGIEEMTPEDAERIKQFVKSINSQELYAIS